jgi:Zn-dependent protease
MRDPFAWSIPLGRLFGILIRVHVLFPLLVLALVLRTAYTTKLPDGSAVPDGAWIDAAMVLGLLFVSVLLHEFGHCFGARLVNGDAQEILIWPLGGLASVDVPNTPRANFLMVAAGPLVNLVLCVLCAVLLYFLCDGAQPPWDPRGYPGRGLGTPPEIALRTWGGLTTFVSTYSLAAVLARLFWVNYFLFLLNVLLIGFPLDGGRLFQCILWPHVGYRQATLAAVFAGFIVMFIVALYAIVATELLALCLAMFIYTACKHQWILIETGGEDGLFGYDFSQGYTSLERDQPAPPPALRRPGWWQRWRQRRTARRIQREQEQREAEEQRMEQLLDKVHRQGRSSLTDEELRFMKRFSERYRNRH